MKKFEASRGSVMSYRSQRPYLGGGERRKEQGPGMELRVRVLAQDMQGPGFGPSDLKTKQTLLCPQPGTVLPLCLQT